MVVPFVSKGSGGAGLRRSLPPWLGAHGEGCRSPSATLGSARERFETALTEASAVRAASPNGLLETILLHVERTSAPEDADRMPEQGRNARMNYGRSQRYSVRLIAETKRLRAA